MNGSKKKDAWHVENVDEALNREMLQHFKGERDGYIQIGPMKYILPQRMTEDIEKVRNFQPRSTDVWVVTYPRSGTTWTQELVWMVANGLDYVKSKEVLLLERFPFFEFGSCVSRKILDEFLENASSDELKQKIQIACQTMYEPLKNTKERRFIKTHLPLSLLPADLLTSGAKVIYVARNPKDVAVSFYNFHKFIKTLDFVGDFTTFWNYFQRNLTLWAPYWTHIIEAWNLKTNPNLLFMFFEDMKKDLPGSIIKVAEFLGEKCTGKDLEKLVDHLEFKNFSKNDSVNMESLRELGMLRDNDQKCVRSGRAGGWNQYFDEKLNAQADAWINENLKNTDLRFPAGL